MVGASQEVKNYGFRSLKECARYAKTSPKYLGKLYRLNQKRFWEYVSKAFEAKFIN